MARRKTSRKYFCETNFLVCHALERRNNGLKLLQQIRSLNLRERESIYKLSKQKNEENNDNSETAKKIDNKELLRIDRVFRIGIKGGLLRK